MVTTLVSRKIIASYSSLAGPMSIIYFSVFIFLGDFYASNYDVSLAELGIIFLFVRLFDAISDPIIGILSDTFLSKWGLRRVWIVLGTPIVLISTFALFWPQSHYVVDFQYLFIWLLLLTFGWTMILNPYFALGAELSQDYFERSRITFFRESISLAGILIAALIYSLAADSLLGMKYIALFVLITLPFSVFLCVYHSKEDINKNLIPEKYSFKRIYMAIKSEPMFVRLLIAYFVNGAANGLPAALFIFFVNYKLKLPHFAGPLLLVYFGAAIIAIPFWLKLSKKIAKHKLWCYAMFYASIVFLFTIFVGTGDLTYFTIICFLSGAALGVDLAIPSSIQADLIDVETINGGKRRTSTFFSLWSIATKGAIAISSGLGFVILSYFGFSTVESNSQKALWGLLALYAIVPIILKFFAILLMWNFRMDQKFHASIQKQLIRISAVNRS